MDTQELRNTLLDLQPGQVATLNYELFDQVFPPGVEDDDAKVAAYELAKASGCVIRHHEGQREVNFEKG